MKHTDETAEKRAGDAITHGLLSLSLLEQLMMLVFSDKRDSKTVGQFYDDFTGTHQCARFVPFNEGAVLAALYLAILYVHENWKDVIPDQPLCDWDIVPLTLIAPKENSPDRLPYIVRRIRNSLGHGTPSIDVLSSITRENGSAVTVTFKDANQRDPNDTFEIKLTLEQVFHLAKKLHQTAIEALAKKYNIIPQPKPLTA